MDFLNGLNDAQKKAVLYTKGPLMIVAGAGAGKTKTITHRIGYLMSKEGGNISGEHILAITFTNKAAKEMRERVYNMLPEGVRVPTLKTFHSLSVMILREHAEKIKRNKHFTIADESDSLAYIKEVMAKEGVDPKQFEPRKIRGMISKWKGDGLTSQEIIDTAAGNIQSLAGGVWHEYDKLLASENALDFDDLIKETVNLLAQNADIRKYYQDLWQYIHVDEYQDTNELQYRFTKLLVGDKENKEQNLCVVGDADQNIYSWRGANMKNMLHFEKDYPDAEIVFLEENYRSTDVILAAANAIIEKNVMRVPKKLFTQKNGGGLITLCNAYDEKDEARFVVEKSDALIRDGVMPDDIAVLYRANFQSRVLEEACLHKNVPYQVLGTKFFDRKEVKDMISYIRAAQSRKNLADIRRAINMPSRGIGKVTIAKLFAGEGLSGAIAKKVENFYTLLDKIEAYLNQPTSALLSFILRESGIQETLKRGNEEDLERLENIFELIEVAKRYDTLPEEDRLEQFLTDFALMGDQDSDDGQKHGIRLMTVHASKGLEFKHVFIVGLEEGLFPHERMNAEKYDDEEERRLFYVALTRAEEKLYLSYASVRTVFGSRNFTAPSSFLSDVPQELIEAEENLREDGRERVIYFDI